MSRSSIIICLLLLLGWDVQAQEKALDLGHCYFNALGDVVREKPADSGRFPQSTLESLYAEILNLLGEAPLEVRVKRMDEFHPAKASFVFDEQLSGLIEISPDYYLDRNPLPALDTLAILIPLAHELAHLISGHRFSALYEDSELMIYLRENQADYLAGAVVAHIGGGTLGQVQQLLSSLIDEQASRSHPSRAERMAYFFQGWLETQGEHWELALPFTLRKERYAKFDNYLGQWKGNVQHGKPHGFGIFYYPTGNCYFGHWKDGKREGYGVLEYGSEDALLVKYAGQFRANMESGRGVGYLKSGKMMKGNWDRGSFKGMERGKENE